MKSIDDYIDKSPTEYIPIIEILRKVILGTLPTIQEKISYGIPFYYHYGPLCYINPRKKVVDLGFSKGYALSNKQGVLESKNRSHVQTISFDSSANINTEVIREIILEAIMINEFRILTK